MGTPVAAHTDLVYVRTDTTAPTGADMVAGLTDASLKRLADWIDTNYLGSAGFKSRVLGLRDTSVDLSGHSQYDDAPQGLLRTAADAGTTLYVTVHRNPTGGAGLKGFRIPMVVTGYDEKFTPGSLVEFSMSLAGNGAPTAV